MTEKVIISCITPTFNRAHLIGRAIKSTIKQTYPYWEMIIVDDGSSDNTEEIVEEYVNTDPRIKYFKNPGGGGNAARNYGIDQAQGEWIAFLDDDDVSLSHRFEKQINAAQKTGGNFISSWFYISNLEDSKLKPLKREPLHGLGDGLPSRWLIKKQLLLEAGGFDEKQTAMQDNELSYRLGQIEKYIVHREYVSVIYNTKNSLSRNTDKSIQGKLELLNKWSHIMPSFEYALWCYSLAKDYVISGNFTQAQLYFQESKKSDNYNYFKGLITIELVLMNISQNRIVKGLMNRIRNSKKHYPIVIHHITFP